MAKVSVALNSTEAATGKKLQKTLTDINASATSAQIKTFAQALNNLTTNNYIETNRIEKTNVDTEESGGGGGTAKPSHTLTVTQDWWASDAAKSYYISFTYDGNISNVKPYFNRESDVFQPEFASIKSADGNATIKVQGYNSKMPTNVPIIIYEAETDEYAPFIWTGTTPTA